MVILSLKLWAQISPLQFWVHLLKLTSFFLAIPLKDSIHSLEYYRLGAKSPIHGYWKPSKIQITVTTCRTTQLQETDGKLSLKQEDNWPTLLDLS